MSLTRSAIAATLFVVSACGTNTPPQTEPPVPPRDARVGLPAGLFNAGEAISNLKVVSKAVSPERVPWHHQLRPRVRRQLRDPGELQRPRDLGHHQSVVAGPGDGVHVPRLAERRFRLQEPHVHVGGSDQRSRGLPPGGVRDTVSQDRMRGVRIFDISDIRNPKLVKNVQTCRGSHTHTVLEHPSDRDNVYIYVSGSSAVRSPNELPGCVRATPDQDPNSSLWRIEIIKVPVANPERAEVVNRANIFTGLKAPAVHGAAQADIEAARRALEAARTTGVASSRRARPPARTSCSATTSCAHNSTRSCVRVAARVRQRPLTAHTCAPTFSQSSTGT